MSKETHDRKVRQLANKLEKQGFNVKADLDGFETPDGIAKGDHVPDIFATKAKAHWERRETATGPLRRP